jgi:hypothetical protein
MKSRPRRYLRDAFDRFRRFFKREPEPGSPDDPYALVGLPKSLVLRSAAPQSRSRWTSISIA